MTVYRRFLIVRADGNTRVTTRRPGLSWDEVAFPLTIRCPDAWGRVLNEQTVDLLMPDPPVPTLAFDGAELAEVDAADA